MQITEHLIIVLKRTCLLILQESACASRKAGKEQQKVIFQIEHGVHVQLERFRGDAIVFMECKACDAAISCNILVLFSDRFTEPLNLDVTGELCQLLGMYELPAMRVKRFEQGGGEATGRPETSPCRNVRERRDFGLRRAQI